MDGVSSVVFGLDLKIVQINAKLVMLFIFALQLMKLHHSPGLMKLKFMRRFIFFVD